MPYAAVRGILGVVPLEAPVQRQAHLASRVDPAVNLVLAVSTAQVAGSGLTAARRRGRAHERLGANEGTNDSDTRQLRLAHACATAHRLHLLARIEAGVVTGGQRLRHAEQGLTGRVPYGSTEG